jgi:alpha-glucosidase
MNQPYNEQDMLLSSIFSDGTGLFRQPPEPEPGDCVAVRLRIQKGADVTVTLLKGFPTVMAHMSRYNSDETFDWYEGKIYCREASVYYSFLIRWGERYILYNRLGPRWVDDIPSLDPTGAFEVIPGFHVPQWAKGALQYQILPDRFRSGNPDSDVLDR